MSTTLYLVEARYKDLDWYKIGGPCDKDEGNRIARNFLRQPAKEAYKTRMVPVAADAKQLMTKSLVLSPFEAAGMQKSGCQHGDQG